MALIAIILILTTATVILSKEVERSSVFESTAAAFESMVELEALGIDDGYFYWNDLYAKVVSGDIGGADNLLQEIVAVYPGTLSVRLEQGPPPENSFDIVKRDGDFIIFFGVKDDFGNHTAEGWRSALQLDTQEILDSVQGSDDLRIVETGGRDFAFGLRAQHVDPLLGLRDYALIILISIAISFPLVTWLQRKSVFFYETHGLESIIFLFEQSERFSANHSRRVAGLAVFVGEKMGYRKRQLRNLYTAALLHDIGKISIPLEILLKTGELNDAEVQVIQSHPIISAKILQNFRELAHLGPVVLHHHERMDGSGYPEGFAGDSIPHESRIIAVVDVFEALGGDRPYRKPIDPEECFALMRGMPLDQEIVETLAKQYPEFASYKPPRWTIAYDQSPIRI